MKHWSVKALCEAVVKKEPLMLFVNAGWSVEDNDTVAEKCVN